jgi:protein-S-isoprenylcysteine O-methyltransferase Ste14
MNNQKGNPIGVLNRWLSWYFRATVKKAGLFALIVIILTTGHPSDKSLLIGLAIVIIGIALRLWASGYPVADVTVSGPYRYMRYPHQFGTGVWLVGIAVTGRQMDIVLLACVLAGLVLTREIRNWDAQYERTSGHSFHLYQKVVPSIFPSFIPLETTFMKREFGFLAAESDFSIKRAFLVGYRENEGEIVTIFYTLVIEIAFFMLHRFDGIVPVKPIFLVGCFVFLIGRVIFFAIRGERRMQPRSTI